MIYGRQAPMFLSNTGTQLVCCMVSHASQLCTSTESLGNFVFPFQHIVTEKCGQT